MDPYPYFVLPKKFFSKKMGLWVGQGKPAVA
jgi:hypothetical protein